MRIHNWFRVSGAYLTIKPTVNLFFCSSIKMEFKMYSSDKWLHRLSFSISVILIILNFCWPTWAQSAEPDSQKDKTVTFAEKKVNTESSSNIAANEIPKEPHKIYQVGQKVGQQIDDMTRQASSRIWHWINAEVFAGMTWFKLILMSFPAFYCAFN